MTKILFGFLLITFSFLLISNKQEKIKSIEPLIYESYALYTEGMHIESQLILMEAKKIATTKRDSQIIYLISKAIEYGETRNNYLAGEYFLLARNMLNE